MKKLIFVFLILIGLVAAPVFAWDPEDLTTYPSCTKAGDIVLNLGVGFGYPGTIGGDYIYVPPIRLTGDYNIAIGEKNLPFFAGLLVGYSGYGYKNDYYYSRIPVGGRFGYHFNWGIDKLDTYAVTVAGWIIHAGDGIPDNAKIGWPMIGINVGARYFVTDWFGFWAEVGYTSLSFADIGISFKF